MVNFGMKFGGGGRPRPARSGGFGDETWIKSFRDERTTIRPQVEPALTVSEYLDLLDKAIECTDCDIPAPAVAALRGRANAALADGKVLNQPGVKAEHEWFNPVPTAFDDAGEITEAVGYAWCEVHNPDNNQFYFTRTHYDQNFWTFPCARYAGADWCLGEDALGMEKSDQAWIFNAIDDEGHLNVYRCGWTVFNALYNYREVSDNHTVFDAAFVVVRSNPTGKKTEYSAVAKPIKGDYAPLPVSGHVRIEPLLVKQYEEVLDKARKANIEIPMADAPLAEPAAEPAKAAPAKAAKAAPAKAAAAPAAEPAGEAQGELPWDKVGLRFLDLGTGELKDMLEANKIAFPKSAPRTKILEIVEAAVNDGTLPDF